MNRKKICCTTGQISWNISSASSRKIPRNLYFSPQNETINSPIGKLPIFCNGREKPLSQPLLFYDLWPFIEILISPTSYKRISQCHSPMMPFCLPITTCILVLLQNVRGMNKSTSNFGAGCPNWADWADIRFGFVHSMDILE